jgi:hypothetical protein
MKLLQTGRYRDDQAGRLAVYCPEQGSAWTILQCVVDSTSALTSKYEDQ